MSRPRIELSWACLAAGLVACSAGPVAAPVEVVAPVGMVAPGSSAGELLSENAVDPAPRPGNARRFLRLPLAGSPGAPLRVAMDVPASWGVRGRDSGGRALRPCPMSPSSPSELFVQTRSACGPAGCVDHELLADDLVRARLISPADIESRGSEPKGPNANITRLSGHLGTHVFSAFRYVVSDRAGLTPVACEAFLFEDETVWLSAYEAACVTLRIAPPDVQEGPEELAPAPDGQPRGAAEEAATQSALGYISALALRDAKVAITFLLTPSECIASGGPAEECESGAEARKAGVTHGMAQIPEGLAVSTADVRSPVALSGLLIATVKKRGDPCGPGYEVTLAKGDHRFAVTSAEPTPDPRLLPQ